MRALAFTRTPLPCIVKVHAGWQKFTHSIFSPFRYKTLYYSLRKRTSSHSQPPPNPPTAKENPLHNIGKHSRETRCTTNFPRRQRLQCGSPLSSPPLKNTTTAIYLRRQSLYTPAPNNTWNYWMQIDRRKLTADTCNTDSIGVIRYRFIDPRVHSYFFLVYRTT